MQEIDLNGKARVTAEHTQQLANQHVPGLFGQSQQNQNRFGPEHLLKNGTEVWNKWYQDKAYDSWVTIDFQSVEQTIVGIGFRSAGDVPQRDPETVIVSCRDYDQPQSKGDSWKQVAALGLQFDNKRWFIHQFVI